MDHKERRKLQRKEQREEARLLKKRKLKGSEVSHVALEADKNVNQENGMMLERESSLRKSKAIEKMKLLYYKNAIIKVEQSLRFSRVYNDEYFQKNYPKSKLKGAARPAKEVYPEYYPELYEEMKKREMVEDLIEINKGKLCENEKTLELVKLKFLQAVRYNQFHQNNNALANYKLILSDFDSSSRAFTEIVLPRLVAIHIEKTNLCDARKLISEYSDLQNSFLKWDMFLIEYISRHVLEEDTSEETVEGALFSASQSNRDILKALLTHEAQLDKIAHPDDIAEDEASALEQYFSENRVVGVKIVEENVKFSFPLHIRYLHRSISWYKDADGIFKYLKRYAKKIVKSEKSPTPAHPQAVEIQT